MIALAGLELDEGNVEEAVALVEELRAQAAGELDLRHLYARVAAALGESDRASTIMGELRLQAGEAWQPEHDALLRGLQR